MQETTPPTTAELQARIEALELMLQALVLVLETEPEFTAEKLLAWVNICTQRMRTTASATTATLAAFDQLKRNVLE